MALLNIPKIDRNVMTLSRHPQINEELLSAYLDNEVTEEERTLIEAAIAADPAVAWHVNSLRETVQLLQALPPLALPRTFAIESILTDGQAKTGDTATQSLPDAMRRHPPIVQRYKKQENDWWQWLQQLWQGGNLYLRNATAVAFAFLLVLFASDQFVAPYQPLAQQAWSTGQRVTTAPEVTNNRAITAIAVTAADVGNAIATQPAATPGITSNSVPTAAAIATTENSTRQEANEGLAPTAAKRFGPELHAPQEDIEALDGSSFDSAGRFAQPQADASSARLQTATDAARLSEENSIQAPMTEITGQGESLTDTQMTESSMPIAQNIVTATVQVTTNVAITVTPPISPVTVVTATEAQQATRETPSSDHDQVQGATNPTAPWLLWAQMIAALFTVVLGSLWWRSRG